MAVIYVGMVGAWLGEMVRLYQHVLPVHFLCLLCIVVKMLESVLVAVYYRRQVGNTIASIFCLGATATNYYLKPQRGFIPQDHLYTPRRPIYTWYSRITDGYCHKNNRT